MVVEEGLDQAPGGINIKVGLLTDLIQSQLALILAKAINNGKARARDWISL